ncbi:MAG: inositol monophosphatase [Candidatus Taylorbacteria bacterium CG11_big_fil_rev_8_21_14_0_20_46_11]|uniref:Inositol-1-monophosphatase n=1 Tax=Candidatus Taylorbacteria bacterium CG11_big_fil_rev_8_21_14_0_20_46_11 TaxID=1975025 RepID=A0A2H0KCB1_9BACT|nr:MAG: inositol monophosphatase [Candidatus Taylorbacteria bacterium CG11_big_fil_rev_8_21_14_0_20_46_11]
MDLLSVAMEAAKKGGAVVSSYFETALSREVKEDKSFVTAADKESETVILAEIKKHFPNHGILSEESEEQKSASPYQWVIDPLDGTANFLNGIPMFAVSIAVLQDGVPVAGVVYHPIGDAMYAAAKGKGMTWKGKSVRVSEDAHDHAMISFGPGKREKEHLNKMLSNAESFVKSKRYLGCTALELGFVARGGTEGFICIGLNKWDYAAGVLLAQEAGGTITDFEGKPWIFGSSDFFIASNGVVHSALLKLVASTS